MQTDKANRVPGKKKAEQAASLRKIACIFRGRT
jgi:hypothetical protein